MGIKGQKGRKGRKRGVKPMVVGRMSAVVTFFRFAASAWRDYGLVMKTSISFVTSLAVFVAVLSATADQVTLQNGDVLNGKVQTVTANTLTLQDESLGTLTLARAKVSNIRFGTAEAARSPAPGFAINSALNPPAEAGTPEAPANSLSDLRPVQTSPGPAKAGTPNTANCVADSALRAIAHEIREHSNLVNEVEAQVMGSSASPEAANKFNELLDELSSGQLDMNGLRAQAQSAADQLQEFKKEMGPNAGGEVDGYLSILNHFLSETSPTNGP